MSRALLFFILMIVPGSAFSQSVNTLTDSMLFPITEYSILPDRGYTFEKVLSDTSLSFTVNDSLRPQKSSVYWLKMKVANPFPNAEQYRIRLEPYLDNTWYYFDANDQKWVTSRTGTETVSYNERRNNWFLSYTAQGQKSATFYVKINESRLTELNRNLKPEITFEKDSLSNNKEQLLWVGWVCGLCVLLLFFLNNLYIYFSFRHRIVRYYLIAQLGSIIYIIAYRQFFHVLFFRHIFTIGLDASGSVMHYDFNNVFMHIGVVLLLYGLIQQTRSYLNTKKRLPKLNALLKYGLYGYIVFSSFVIAINTLLLYVEPTTLLVDNVLVLALILLLISASVVGYVYKLPVAGTLLLANVLPLVLIVITTLFHVFFDLDDSINLLLPTLAIVFQSFSFSLALVARTKSIQNDLVLKEKEARQLELDLADLELWKIEIEEENQKITSEIQQEKFRNEQLHEKLEANQRELASTALYIAHKNKLLLGLKEQINELNRLNPDNDTNELQELSSMLQSNRLLDDNWNNFILHFEKVHPHFFKNAEEKYPSLTKNELRLYAYSHINLSNKEIATMLNIDPGSVRRAKTRLSKKMVAVNQE